MELISVKDLENLSFIFHGKTGNRLAKYLIRLFDVTKINKLYNSCNSFHGPAFASKALEYLKVDYLTGYSNRLKSLPSGAFITVSNHPYGGLDGIILADLLGNMRPDYKIIANQLLLRIKAMDECFIPVTPTEEKKDKITATSIYGIREALMHLKEGHPVGVFPAGAISDFHIRNMRINDRGWQESILNVIRHAKVPILPVRFFDGNSVFFYTLGLLDWRIRLTRLPHELFNKSKKKQRIGIGEIISVKEQEKFTDGKSLGMFLRKKIYEMPMPHSFTQRDKINFSHLKPSRKQIY